jgi:integrase
MPRTRNPNGMGSIKKRSDGRYQWHQEKDGDKRDVYAKSPGELREKIKKVSNLPIVTSKLTVDEWFQKWLASYIEPPLKKEATYNQYKDLYNQHIKPVIGKRKIRTIEKYDIQRVISETAKKNSFKRVKNKETGKFQKVDTGRPLSTWTLKHIKKILNIAFSQAVEDKVIGESPVRKIQIPKRQPKERKTLTINELYQLFKAMENSRWMWSAKFMLHTGIRRGELLALKWSDIDFKNKRMTINKSYSSTGLGDTKSAKVHYVPLSESAISFLRGQMAMLEKEFNPCLHNDELKKDPPVFPNKSGEMLQPNSYYTTLARFAKKAEIYASPHCLRHSFVYYNRKKLTRKEVQDALGHEKSTTTDDIYGLILDDSTEETAGKIDDVFAKVNQDMQNIEIEKALKDNKSSNIIPFRRTKKAN